MDSATVHFLRWLWENSLGATLLCLLVVTLTCLARRILPSVFRYALWLLVMLRLVWPFSPAAEFSVMNLMSHREAHVAVTALETPSRVSLSPPTPALGGEPIVAKETRTSLPFFAL